MKKLSNTEAELKRSVAYKKRVYYARGFSHKYNHKQLDKRISQINRAIKLSQ